VAATAGLLALAVVVITPTKLFTGYLTGRLYDLDARRSVRVGCGIAARGEFSLIIAVMVAGEASPVLSEVIPAFAVGYVLATSVLGTTLMAYPDELAARACPSAAARRRTPRPTPTRSPEPDRAGPRGGEPTSPAGTDGSLPPRYANA